jgi:hypothetical protein
MHHRASLGDEFHRTRRSQVRNAIGKDKGDSVIVCLNERIR